MLTTIQDFIASLPEVLQLLGVALAGAIPFIESYLGSALGIVVGVNPVAAVTAAIVGNIVSMLIVVLAAHGVRSRVTTSATPSTQSPRRAKLQQRFDRYGVPGVSLLGQTLLPSQITSAAMVSFGASKNQVILWQIISIIAWGIIFGVLAALGVAVVR